MTRDQVLVEVLAARPPGYFDHARPLLLQFVDLRAEIAALWPRLHRLRPGTEESLALTIELGAKMQAAGELGSALGLYDRERPRPPPRLQ